MKKQQSIICLLLFFNFLQAQTSYSPEVQEKIKQFENSFSVYWFQTEGDSNPTLQDRMNYYHVKGLSIAVVHNYKIEWAKAYGWADEEEKRPATTETPFQACSVSKSLNAVGVLKLVQDKKIDLYADINTYLTSWKFPYNNIAQGKKISTANLLSHTAGLSIHGFGGFSNAEPMPAVVQVLDGMPPAKNKPVRSESRPGLRYQYSGGGVMISQLILTDITHEVYAEYMQKNVFEPFGMMNSFYTQPVPKEKEKLLAAGYLEDGTPIAQKFYAVPQAAGGMWTTPTDICKYIIEMQLSLQGKSNKVLTKETAQRMTTPYIDNKSALGVFIDKHGDENYFWHSGGNIGFKCQYIGSMENGNGLMVMVNSSNGGIIDETVINIAKIYGWKDFSPAKSAIVKKGIINLPEKELDKYTGAYRQGDVIVKIIKRDNSLWYQGFEGGGTNAWKIYFTSVKDFFSKESRSEKSFYTDAKGNVQGFSKTMNGKGLGKSEKIPLINLPDSLMKLYSGKYDYWGTTADVYKRGEGLWVKVAEGYEMELNFISTTEFFILSEEDTYGEIFRFDINNNGEVDSIIEMKGDTETKNPRIR